MSGFDERHRRQTFHPRAAQELQQHGLGLVVGVVRERNQVRTSTRKRGVARFARRSLGAVTPLHLDASDSEGHAEGPAPRTAKARPRRGVRAQLVIDVQRPKLEAHPRRDSRKKIEENDRVDAAAQAQQQPVARPHGRFQMRGDVRREIARRCLTSLRLP